MHTSPTTVGGLVRGGKFLAMPRSNGLCKPSSFALVEVITHHLVHILFVVDALASDFAQGHDGRLVDALHQRVIATTELAGP